MQNEKRVVLRDIRDAGGLRHLSAMIAPNGDVRIEGQDLGRGVEAFWGEGFTEYEYAMTIQAADVPALRAALGEKTNLLAALQKRFSDPAEQDPKSFLEAHAVPYTFWSRIGD